MIYDYIQSVLKWITIGICALHALNIIRVFIEVIFQVEFFENIKKKNKEKNNNE